MTGSDDGGLDNPFLSTDYDHDKPELGDVEPSLPYSYFVARNPHIGNKKFLDFLIEEEILNTSGHREHHDSVRLPEGELSWDSAMRSHMDRILKLFKTLDGAIPQGTGLLPADWGIIVHMLGEPLTTKAANWSMESGEKLFISNEAGSRACEWLYIHYLLNSLDPQRKGEIYAQMFTMSPEEMFPTYEPIPEAGTVMFPITSVQPVSFFNRLSEKLTDEEGRMMNEKIEALQYRQTNRTINTIKFDSPGDIYTVCPELAKYHVNFTNQNLYVLASNIAHHMNQSIYKQMMHF